MCNSKLFEDIFSGIDQEMIDRERKRMIEEGRIKEIETPFGTIAIINHPLFTKDQYKINIR